MIITHHLHCNNAEIVAFNILFYFPPVGINTFFFQMLVCVKYYIMTVWETVPPSENVLSGFVIPITKVADLSLSAPEAIMILPSPRTAKHPCQP